MRNQGDGWTWTLDFLAARSMSSPSPGRRRGAARSDDIFADIRRFAAAIGHAAGRAARGARHSRPTSPAFAPRDRRDDATLADWADGAIEQLDGAFDDAARRTEWPDDDAERVCADLLDARRSCSARRARPCRGRRRAPSHPHPWRLPSRPGAGGAGRRLSSSTSKASRRARWSSAARKIIPLARRGRAAAFASTTPPPRQRRSRAATPHAAERAGRAARQFRAARPARFLGALSQAIATAAEPRWVDEPDASQLARPVPDRKGGLRNPLRGRQPAHLARHSAARPRATSPTLLGSRHSA